MKTSRNLAILAITALLISCGSQKADKNSEHKCISPLSSGINVENLQDCVVPAQFTNQDFNWMGGLLTMTVYNVDLYDAVEISQLQVGDTIIYDGAPIVINKIDDTEGGIDINEGKIDEGGCILVPNEGGTYIARSWDDHATYTKLGKAQVPLAENFIIIDCGMNPEDPSDTIRVNQKLYLENLKDGRADFSPLDTRVTIEKGAITEIDRHWIP